MLYITLIAALVAIGTALALLSLMREVVMLRGDVSALSQLITEPPEPDIIGKPMPDAILSKVRDAPSASHLRPSGFMCAIFLSDDCGACGSLTDDLVATVELDPVIRMGICGVVPLTVPQPSSIAPRLAAVGIPVVGDDGSLSSECGLRATPLAICFERDSGRATEFEYGPDLAWVMGRLKVNNAAARLEESESSEVVV